MKTVFASAFARITSTICILNRLGHVVALILAATSASAQPITFSDNFDTGASPLWGNQSGNWVASGGVYSAQNSGGMNCSALPFNLTNFTVEVDINSVADGGIWLRCDGTGANGILLVTGGDGWGWGSRVGQAGRALYFHVVTNGSFSPYLSEVTNVFTPTVDNPHLRVEVVGNKYSLFLNGATTPITTLIDSTFSSGLVGLYDRSDQTFDNFLIQEASSSSQAATIYVANSGNNTITKFTDGIGSVFASTGLSNPQALALDSAGNLYVANWANNTIVKFTPGGVGSVFASTGLDHPVGLAFDGAGNLFAANQYNGTIVKFTPGGVGSVFATGVSSATGLAFDNAGNLFVTVDGAVWKFTPGGVSSVFASGLNQPSLLAFDTAGNLFVGEYGDRDILKYTPGGIGSVFANTGLNYPYGMAFDSQGNLYVVNVYANSVAKFTPGGVGSVFANTGLSGPTGIAVLAVNPPPPCVASPAGLVRWWRGEGNALDNVGDIDGTLVNEVAFTSGKVGQAFSFDGVNDGITNSGPSLIHIVSSFTMEFWAFPNASRASTVEATAGLSGISNQRYAIFPSYGGDSGVNGAGVSVGTNGVSVFEHGNTYLPSLLVYDAPIIGWTHIAVVYENQQPKLYINGVFVRVGLTSTAPAVCPSTWLGTGSWRGYNYGHYAGLLDEVSIFDRPLSVSEIQAIYNAGSAGKCVSQGPGEFLLNMDFQGANLTASSKTGFAALGLTATDYWNYYMREDGQGGWRTFGTVTNLHLADGTITEIGMTVANAPGAWCAGSSDAMYDCYIYPFSGNATITVTNLPAGVYDVLPYAVDGNYEVTVGGVSYGIKSSLDDPLSNPPVWKEGVQYARFTNVQVSAGQPLALTVRPGVSGYAVISGMQIAASTSTNTPPPPCSAPPSGLVSWWRAEGTALDEIGGNNGEFVNNVKFTNGVVGQGFLLDGAGSYVRVPHNASLNFSNELTVEFWYKDLGSPAQYYGLVAKRAGGANESAKPLNFGINVEAAGTRGVQVYFNDPTVAGADAFEVSRYSPVPAVGIFHHLAATWRQADSDHVEMATFIDGQLVKTQLCFANLARTINEIPVTIGISTEIPYPEYFHGVIDEVSLYRRALSATEIQAIYNAGNAGKCVPVPPVNHPPVADASATKPLLIVPAGCKPAVVLDGSRSVDPDGGALQYLWFKAGEAAAFATGEVAVVTLPSGVHNITLIANDGLATATNAVTVTVITARQAVQRLVVQVNESNIERPRPLLAMLSAAADSLRRHQPRIAITQLRAFQRLVQAGVSRHDPVLAATLVEAAQEVIEALSQDCALAKPDWKFGKLHRHGHGQMRMEFSAPEGQRCLIEASTNMVDWVAIGSANECGPGEFEFEDPDAARLPARFYRIVAE